MDKSKMTGHEAIRILREAKSCVVGRVYGLHDAVEMATNAINDRISVENFALKLEDRLVRYSRGHGENNTLDDVFRIIHEEKQAVLEPGKEKDRIEDWLSNNIQNWVLNGAEGSVEMDLAEDVLLSFEPSVRDSAKAFLSVLANDDIAWREFMKTSASEFAFDSFSIISPAVPESEVSTFELLTDTVYDAWKQLYGEQLGR